MLCQSLTLFKCLHIVNAFISRMIIFIIFAPHHAITGKIKNENLYESISGKTEWLLIFSCSYKYKAILIYWI